ncbi:uncharacterized protein MYCFIDRAFT_82305 [Pseudocercospora fijiensis CIRAD86]|uniref:Uncharacterized protein n=1 Tax=Pseudocercospora fijiensis (strain CIRAD86) TaxID=383855 RepID=M2YXE6_PSEFD|nr:uncharacterized protein MYCFIDRAFT_82305 [Pseudocercospora fijiensis CIRAD86]EME82385.1 hypothetical protein MYCFIDRAFT_82305 [Pseudocercospora fijiensis CIRAD86]
MSSPPPSKKARTSADKEKMLVASHEQCSSPELDEKQCSRCHDLEQIIAGHQKELRSAHVQGGIDVAAQEFAEWKQKTEEEKREAFERGLKEGIKHSEQQKFETEHAYLRGLEEGKRIEQDQAEKLRTEIVELKQQEKAWSKMFENLVSEKREIQSSLGSLQAQGLQQGTPPGQSQLPLPSRALPPQQQQNPILHGHGTSMMCSGTLRRPHIPLYVSRKPPHFMDDTVLVYRAASLHKGRTVVAIAPAYQRDAPSSHAPKGGMWVYVRKDTLVAHPNPTQHEHYPKGDWGMHAEYYGYQRFEPAKLCETSTLAADRASTKGQVSPTMIEKPSGMSMAEDTEKSRTQFLAAQESVGSVNQTPNLTKHDPPEAWQQVINNMALQYRDHQDYKAGRE